MAACSHAGGGRDASSSTRHHVNRLMGAAVAAGAMPRVGAPVALFQTHVDARSRDALLHFDYDVSADGQRIITLAGPETEAVTPWTVVINWPAGLSGR